MEKLTCNQQDKLDHLYFLMQSAGLLDSVQKAAIFLNQFGEYESRYYGLDYDAIVGYVFTRMKKWWLFVYCHEADNNYCHLTAKEKIDTLGYCLDDWKGNIDIEHFDTLQEVKEQAIKDAINKALLNQKEKESKK